MGALLGVGLLFVVLWPAPAASGSPASPPSKATASRAEPGVAEPDAAEPGAVEPGAAEPDTAESSGERARAAVEDADRRFNRAAREREREGFRALLAEDATFLAGELHRGRLAVMAIWQHLFDGKYDFRYDAETIDVRVARSGELAWSVGRVETRFQRPGAAAPEKTGGHYLHLWRPGEDGAWRLAYLATLVVHPELGVARDPRSGLMTAWPELADQIGADVEIRWQPEVHQRAESGELAFTFGEYEASFQPPGEPGADAADAIAGKGHFLAVWEKDDEGRWQLAAEGLTPPGIYGTR